MTKIRVALLHNIISPYRIPLFESLSSQPTIDLNVYFCAETQKKRKWDVTQSKLYNYEVLSGFTLENSNATFHINPSIIPILIKEKYDVVIISGNPDFTTYFTFITSKLLNIPTVWWSEGIESSQSKLGKVIKPLTKYIVRKVDSVIVPGSLSQNYHIRMGASSEKIFFAPNIVNNDQYINKSSSFKKNKGSLKKQLGFENKKIILYVGQLIERKGVEYLIGAYEKIKKEDENISLVIVGDGVSRNKFENFCIDNRIKDVFFKGWVSEEEKIMFYSLSDLFVLPTLKDVWGLVINEAMCCGLPVISTNAAGSSVDMIQHGENGYVVKPSNVNELYVTIENIIYNEKLKEDMGQKSLSIVESKFSLDSMVDGFISAILYAKLNR